MAHRITRRTIEFVITEQTVWFYSGGVIVVGEWLKQSLAWRDIKFNSITAYL